MFNSVSLRTPYNQPRAAAAIDAKSAQKAACVMEYCGDSDNVKGDSFCVAFMAVLFAVCRHQTFMKTDACG